MMINGAVELSSFDTCPIILTLFCAERQTNGRLAHEDNSQQCQWRRVSWRGAGHHGAIRVCGGIRQMRDSFHQASINYKGRGFLSEK